MRTSRETVYGTFRVLCKVASKVCHDQVKAEDRPYVGAWWLDYITGAGYLVKEVTADSSWRLPLGLPCRPAAEMVRTMDFAIKLLQSLVADTRVLRQKAAMQKALDSILEVE